MGTTYTVRYDNKMIQFLSKEDAKKLVIEKAGNQITVINESTGADVTSDFIIQSKGEQE